MTVLKTTDLNLRGTRVLTWGKFQRSIKNCGIAVQPPRTAALPRTATGAAAGRLLAAARAKGQTSLPIDRDVKNSRPIVAAFIMELLYTTCAG
jgi:hypothetical protein